MPITPVARDVIASDVQRALEEDVGPGDLTASLIPESSRAKARVVCREPAVLSGQGWFSQVFTCLSPDNLVTFFYQDGDQISANVNVCEIEGSARTILSGERTALNFLQTLSGTATLAHEYAQKARANTKILDTRKTIPGLRMAQKYAVRCGGCFNHRIGLYDAILIKENHIKAVGSIARAVKQAKTQHPECSIEVEVENLQEYDEAIQSGVDIILLDNFNRQQIQTAVEHGRGKIKLEISGGVTLDNIDSYCDLGVDYISTGALTKNIRSIDFSMRFV